MHRQSVIFAPAAAAGGAWGARPGAPRRIGAAWAALCTLEAFQGLALS